MNNDDDNNNNNSSKQPSQELHKYLVELKTTISTLKALFNTIDKKAQDEGFSFDEIYEIANIVCNKSSVETYNQTINNNNITIPNNNTKNNNKDDNFLPSYFQHFK